MPKKADHEQIRKELLEAAVKAGAKYGLTGITNQAIGEISGQSEPYIYRYFVNREELIKRAFFYCDDNFFATVEKNAYILRDPSIEKGTHRYRFFSSLWDYAIENFDYPKFYIRYYYSNLFDDEQREEHKRIVKKHIGPFAPIFQGEIDVDFMMHQVFSLFLTNVMDIATGVTADTPESRNKIISNIVMLINPFLTEEEQIKN